MYMAPTPNGMIARENYDESYVSAANWKLFVSSVKRIGNVIIGRKTFEVALKSGVFPIGGALNIVMTSSKIENRWPGRVIFVGRSPKQALKVLKDKGYKIAMVAGGSNVNSSFIKEHLIDELHLDFQPEVFGRGTPLFAGKAFDAKLQLLGVTRLSKNEVQLRYRVVKKR